MTRGLVLLVGLLAASPAWAAPVFDALSFGLESGAANVTWSHTTAGTDRVLCVWGWALAEPARTVDAATYGGIAMTPVPGAALPSLDGYDAKMFCLANPALGTNTVVLTFDAGSAGGGSHRGVAMSYTGVDQTTPVTGGTGAAGTTASSSLSVASASGDLVIAWQGQPQAGVSIAPGAGTIERGDNIRMWAGEKAGAPGSVLIELTNEVGPDTWVILGANLKAAGAPVVTATQPAMMLLGVGP